MAFYYFFYRFHQFQVPGVNAGGVELLVSFLEADAIILDETDDVFIVEVKPVVVRLNGGTADDLAAVRPSLVFEYYLPHIPGLYCNLPSNPGPYKHSRLIKDEVRL